MKTFSVLITLADGTTLTRKVTALSALDLFDKMKDIAKEYPNYVRSESSLLKEQV